MPALRAWIGETYGTGPVEEGEPVLVRGEAFDATWWNVVETEDGWVAIDDEWHFDHPLPADFVVWRALHHFALRNRAQLPEPARGMDAGTFADQLAAAFQQALATVGGRAVRLLGPAECPVFKLKGYYRFHFQVQSESSAKLHDVLRAVLAGAKPPAGVEFQVDVDAHTML